MDIHFAETAALSRSWTRCSDEYRLDARYDAPPRVLARAELSGRREPVEQMLANCAEELDRLYALLRPIGYAMALAEPGGAIVFSRGHEAHVERYQTLGFREGALWSERHEGTNAIGTAIVELQPICVHREQHYRRRHAELSSAGAPIFDAQGRFIAVLNIASYSTDHADCSHALALAVVSDAARGIEERLFRAQYRHCWIAALECAGSEHENLLLAIDGDQNVVGADRKSQRILNLRGIGAEAPTHLRALFEHDSHGFPNARHGDVPIRWKRLEQGGDWHGLITAPDRASSSWHRSLDAGLHTRPRLNLLASLRDNSSRPVPRGGLSSVSMRRVRRYIEERIHELIDGESLAAIAGLSVNHFAHAFKQTVGLPPHQYVLQIRVERAAALLESTTRPLSEIALAVGFSDQSHFCRHFSRLIGSTPGAFRRAARGNAGYTTRRRSLSSAPAHGTNAAIEQAHAPSAM